MSRLVAPIGAGEGNARYYADLLQVHLGTVAAGLRAAGLWPANLPLLLDAAQLRPTTSLLALVRERAARPTRTWCGGCASIARSSPAPRSGAI